MKQVATIRRLYDEAVWKQTAFSMVNKQRL
jgi:hypothetical protein